MSLLTLDEARALRAGKRLVFTNGVFDILHAGHVTYLEQARALGDLLIVGVNGDDSARSLGKGPNRPINSIEDRGRVLGALRCVDGVVAFHERTPEHLIRMLKPEIHVKGGDYKMEDLPETKIVEDYGGKVVILPFFAGRSTSLIIERLANQ